jgi:hypothetical protein
VDIPNTAITNAKLEYNVVKAAGEMHVIAFLLYKSSFIIYIKHISTKINRKGYTLV